MGGKEQLAKILLTGLPSVLFYTTVDEIQAKVAPVHDKEQVLSKDEAQKHQRNV